MQPQRRIAHGLVSGDIGPASAVPSGEDTRPVHDEGLRRATLIALLALVVIWVAACALVDPIGNFPLNDDWVYALGVKSLLDTGRFALPSPSSADVMAQVYWGALFCLPFGFSFTALRLSTQVLGLVGVLATFTLLRDVGAGRRLAFLGALGLAMNPLYFGLANSFMTDVPFVASSIVALWLFVRSLDRDSNGCLIAAFLVALLAVLIRQFSVIVLGGFAVGLVFRRGFNWRNLILALIPVLLGLVVHVAYVHWMLATQRTPSFGAPLSILIPRSMRWLLLSGARNIVAGLTYSGIFLLPIGIVALASWWRLSSSRERSLLVIVAGGLATCLAVVGHVPHARTQIPEFGNVLTAYGLGPLTLRDTYLLHRNLPHVPAWLEGGWAIVAGLAAVCGAIVALFVFGRTEAVVRAFWQSHRRGRTWLPALAVSMAIGYALVLLLLGQAGLFDRYFLVFYPPLCILVVDAAGGLAPSRLAYGVAALVVFIFAGFSVCATHDYLAWNRARWKATEALAAHGISWRDIDGGYEFNGWFGYNPAYVRTKGKSYWWVVDDHYIIASGPLPGYIVTKTFDFRRWLTLEQGHVVILRRRSAATTQG